MVVQEIEIVTKELIDEYIAEAANAAGYESGFGINGCDLSLGVWWAAYCRQSLDQQAHNNRLPEYLFTLAKMAKEHGVVVPREYVLYDHVTGEHLDRPGMQVLRHELIDKKKILGIFFADLRCMSREPAPQQVFERECEIRGIRLMFGDAPGGMDIGSQFARSAITFSNKLTRLSTHGNARAGNIGRVLKGLVPCCRAAYGYRYCRDAEVGANGRIIVKKAWWESDKVDSEGNPIENSPAWVVKKIFSWIADESRTSWWAAVRLNEMNIPAPYSKIWRQNTVCNVVRSRCYTGRNVYNANSKVTNPTRPLGDVTGQIKRTLLRPKPQEEWVFYDVPKLVSEEQWQKANTVLTKRGRGRGKQGKVILVLLRNRIFCPRCGLPLVVRRDGRDKKTYYYCARHYKIQRSQACGFRKFISTKWDEYIWDCVFTLLNDDSWIECQMASEQKNQGALEKLFDSEQRKISQLQAKITKVQTGYEDGIYSPEEAKSRIKGYQKAIAIAEDEILKLNRQISPYSIGSSAIDTLKHKLVLLRRENLESAGFKEKLEMMGLLDIKVYPSEDLKTVRIKTGLGIGTTEIDGSEQNNCGKVMFAPPYCPKARTPILSSEAPSGNTGKM